MSFDGRDLKQLDELLYSRASRVVPMRDIWKGDIGHRVIGLRHDVDDNHGSFDTALRMAEWEMQQGYSSTYFLLHGSSYWPRIGEAVVFEELGHEVGLHVNGIAEGLRQRRDPAQIVREALAELREFVRVEGCAAHGDELCRGEDGLYRFVNDEMFLESPRPLFGDPCRIITHADVALPLSPVSRVEMGLLYDACWLSRGLYLSDSGGRWSRPPSRIAERFGEAQLHMLVHPDWWSRAFAAVTV